MHFETLTEQSHVNCKKYAALIATFSQEFESISRFQKIPIAGLKECILVRLPYLLRTSVIPFGLIVVDSITGVFRGSVEEDGAEVLGDGQPKGIADEIRTRAMDLKEIAASLHSTARSFGLSVICVNQVSDAVDDVQGFGCNKKVPALGLAWSNMITTRLMVSRTSEFFKIGLTNEEAIIRELE
ncbi:hypothetical protein J437_LFUL001598, partial [Ladona fulva]